MKKSILILSVLLFTFNNSYGQWFVKKYQVSDINQLSRTQLEESLKNTKDNIFTYGVIAGIGGGICFVSAFSAWSFEDPSFFEQLIGEKGMSDILTGVGIGFLAGGTIAAIGYMDRKGKIKSAIQRNFPPAASFRFSPKMILNDYTASYGMGLSITYNF